MDVLVDALNAYRKELRNQAAKIVAQDKADITKANTRYSIVANYIIPDPDALTHACEEYRAALSAYGYELAMENPVLSDTAMNLLKTFAELESQFAQLYIEALNTPPEHVAQTGFSNNYQNRAVAILALADYPDFYDYISNMTINHMNMIISDNLKERDKQCTDKEIKLRNRYRLSANEIVSEIFALFSLPPLISY